MVQDTYAVLRAHQRYLKNTLPEDLFRELAGVSAFVAEQGPGDEDEDFIVRPFGGHPLSNEAQSQLSEKKRRLAKLYKELRLFNPNPLSTYESAHTWVDPNGYRLSDRIWMAGVRTRMKVDALLAEAIREGMSATELARRLEQFLIPGRAKIRTDKPYGSDASFDAMRLARSEITRAHSAAALIAARTNPYVGSMDWRLSGSHPKPDICDDLEAGSPYAIEDYVPIPVADSHPNCLCVISPNVNRSQADVTAEIRQGLEDARAENIPPNITPADVISLLQDLVGRELAKLVIQGIAA
jgi:hypothetical protein